ncbi:MAG TPA: hypothetical protein VMW70_16915 [Burkholderiales bacterium]|nr:hypothetical protein [Burkholderiales bacterium]
MVAAQLHLAYTPRGAGLACALMYLKAEPDILGWWIGRQSADFHTAYFCLADFYSTGTRMYASEGADLYGGWKFELTSGHSKPIDPPLPVASDVSHVLEQAQDAFCGRWLLLPGDTDKPAQHRAYTDAELAWSDINFQLPRLNKFTKDEAVWRYYSNDFEAAVGEYLMRRWPLDYRG